MQRFHCRIFVLRCVQYLLCASFCCESHSWCCLILCSVFYCNMEAVLCAACESQTNLCHHDRKCGNTVTVSEPQEATGKLTRSLSLWGCVGKVTSGSHVLNSNRGCSDQSQSRGQKAGAFTWEQTRWVGQRQAGFATGRLS